MAATVCGAPGATGQEFSFDEVRIPVGGRAKQVLALDVNRDGALDLVVATDSVAVLLKGGIGTFEPVRRISAGPNPWGLAAGDFDGDGIPDLVAANHETDYVTVLFGRPGGLFERRGASTLAVGVSPHPHAVAAGDVNGDGHSDVLVDDRGAGGLRLLPGRGDGRFGSSSAIPVGGDPYLGFALADLDDDGDPDLVTPNPGAVAVLRNEGTGRFALARELEQPGLRPFSVEAADVNGDGILDLAAGSGEGEGLLAVWIGSPEGRYRPARGSPFRIPRGPTELASGDLNGDGHTDLVVTSYGASAVTVVLGGVGGLRLHSMEVPGNPWGVASGDFDGDGRDDFATANDGVGEVSVFLARGR